MRAFTTDFEIMRADLCRIMYDATNSHAKYIFGTSVESFKEKDSFVEVRTRDGKTDRFDLLVGADGLGYRTRKLMLGSDAANGFHRLGNEYIAYFTMRRPIREGKEYVATMYTAPGRRSLMTRRHSPHQIQVYPACNIDSVRLKSARLGDIEEEKEAFAEIIRGAGWQTEEILESLKDANDFYCERLGFVKLDSWSHGRVALVGDAAYCPSANTGMGTTSGILGAYILAGEIGKHGGDLNRGDTDDGVATALEAYE